MGSARSGINPVAPAAGTIYHRDMLHRFLASMALLVTSGLLLIAQNENQGPAIKSGETLRITVYREPDFTRTVTVKPDGNVLYPLIGDISAEGLSLSQFSQALQQALSTYINNPRVITERAEPSK
jgi:polysaccharide export outer membrane protein